MGRTGNRNKGFSTLTILLGVLVIVAIAAVSVVAYQRISSKTNDTASTNQPSNQQSGNSTTSTQPQPVTYLTIKEWGVKLPLSSPISDAYYVVSTSFSNDPDGLPSGVWLGLKSLSDASCSPANNNMGNGTGAVGDILRVPQNATDPVSGQPYTQKYPNGATIGGYYYGYQSWMNDNSCIQKSTAQAADSAFATATKGIVAATTTAN